MALEGGREEYDLLKVQNHLVDLVIQLLNFDPIEVLVVSERFSADLVIAQIQVKVFQVIELSDGISNKVYEGTEIDAVVPVEELYDLGFMY